jgi:hypothetical protein
MWWLYLSSLHVFVAWLVENAKRFFVLLPGASIFQEKEESIIVEKFSNQKYFWSHKTENSFFIVWFMVVKYFSSRKNNIMYMVK